jgi:hypothetical protein
MYARGRGFSGPQILDFFSRYSNEIEAYPWGGGAPSRYQIFEDCLARFPPEQQREIIRDLLTYDGPMSHGAPDPADVEAISQWLGGEPGPLARPTPQAEVLNWAHIQRTWRQAIERVEAEPDAAITSARTLLESVCLHVLHERGVAYTNDGDLQRLYRRTVQELQIAPDQQTDQAFRQLTGGCLTVVNAMAGLRNALGDAHGRGPEDAAAARRHARLIVNSACTLAAFLIETHLA